MSARVHYIALSLLPIRWWGDMAAALRSGEPPADLLPRLVAERPSREPIDVPSVYRRATTAAARADAEAITVLTFDDPRYPAALTVIHDPPPALFVAGQVPTLGQAGVAIVGSRAGSSYALEVGEYLARELVVRGVTIVSGLARGVDSAAHRGALAGGGTTIAVLGSGVDVIYPPEHRALAREVTAAGALVSELLPGASPLAQFFPRRNRIISGLVRAVVVIEAGQKSGSLITARCALEQGRDVLAVPGNVLSGRNRGGHALLRDGAKIVEGVDDILEELRSGLYEPAGTGGASKPTNSVPTDPVLSCLLPGEPSDLDQIAERTGLAPARLLPRLFELELQGLVQRAGGGRFVRFDRPC
jgi:DNA processing protein